ncbi:pirin family protein [Abortiporus biennis]
MSSSIKIVPRRSDERGHADHDWLKTFHTFSFAMYQDSEHDHYGSLRVINEDRVAPHTGFGTHGHREFEIFSYIVAGELRHNDSMGNVEILKRGDIQMTSAGTGIRHSEHANAESHSQYFTRHFSDAEKKDKFVRVVAPANSEGVEEKREASGPAPVHSPLSLYASLLSPSTKLSHTLANRKAYIHVVQTSGYNPSKATGNAIKVNGDVELKEGDGAYIAGDVGSQLSVENIGGGVAEVLLFDLE